MSLSISVPRGGISARDRRALAWLIPAVVLVIIARLVILPLWDAASDSSRSLEARQKVLRKYRAAARAVPALELSAASMNTSLADAERGLLTGATPALQSAEVQQLVRDLAAGVGIQLRTVEFTAPKNYSEDYALVGVSTQFTAGIDQLTAFLAALQSSPRILGVDQLRMAAANVAAAGKTPGKKQVAVLVLISGVAKAAPAPSPESAKDAGK
jgi:Tfp pilus assembly protein PilO